MARRLLLLIVAMLAAVSTAAPQQPRNLTKDSRFHRFQSEVMSLDRSVLVMLPPGYDEATETRYPVLYMHDGQSVFAAWRIDEIMKPLFAAGQMQTIIVVCIFNGGSQEARFSDYTPSRSSQSAGSGNADAYGRMIVEELKPIVDAEYRTLRDRANTAIGGTSLGGLVSMYLALKYPAVFGKAAVMSPSVWWDNQMIVREVKRVASKPELQIWLDVGTEEGPQSIAQTKALRDALVQKGWKRDFDLKYLEAKGGEHNEKSFARRAPEMLKYLFPPLTNSGAARLDQDGLILCASQSPNRSRKRQQGASQHHR